MNRDTAQIHENYRSALELAQELLQRKFRQRGYDIIDQQEMLNELAQSALAEEAVVRLIQTVPFNRAIYFPALQTALEVVKKTFFLELNKKRVVPLEKIADFLGQEEITVFQGEGREESPAARKKILQLLQHHLSPASFHYLTRLLVPSDGREDGFLEVLLYQRDWMTHPERIHWVEERIQQLRRLYPEGKIDFQPVDDVQYQLTEQQIISCYKLVLAGLEHSFPPNFFRYEPERRAGVIVRFLVNDYLRDDPLRILREENDTFFIRYKIQSIYRLFNYSLNRVLANAFPRRIQPWMQSRTPENYWEKEEHRIQAIRWLVEERLGLHPDRLGKNSLTRKHFAENGLSYLFGRYYNSVSAALQAAYPHLQPWELGKVPRSYWTEENAARAVRRMVEKNGWQPAQLPALYREGKLTRKTFNQAGLATVFEWRYGKNIYRALSAAYPGRFQPWEFGNVPSEFWKQPSHVFLASQWIARQEGFEEQEITHAVREKRLTFQHFRKYSIGERLKRLSRKSLYNLFFPFFFREQQEMNTELKINTRLKQFIRQQSLPHPLLSLLMYGLFLPMVRQYSRAYQARLERMQRRRERLFSRI